MIKYARYLITIFLLISGGVFFTHYIKLPSTGCVVEVIDGDTIRLKSGVLIRYLGLNAPETKGRNSEGWANKESYWGEKAYLANKGFVLNN